MPSTSKAQHNFMAAVANNPAFAKKAGVPQSVGQDFTAADKALKLPTGARSRPDLQKVNNPKTNQGRNELFKEGGNTMATKGVNPFAKFEKSGKDIEVKGKGKEGSKKEEAFDKSQMGMKRGGGVKKMAEGGMTDTAQDKAMIKKAFKQHDTQEHKGGKGTDLKLAKGGSFRASANGIASKGKTKAAMPKMAGSSTGMKRGGMAC